MVQQQTEQQDFAHGHQAIAVTIRTPAGINHQFHMNVEERVATVAKTAERYFTSHNELAPGAYGMVLLRGDQATEMNDAGRLEDYGVREGGILVLVAKGPQVDG